MKKNLTILTLLLLTFSVKSQSPIRGIDTSSAPAASSLTYTSGDTTYNWGVSPNNSVLSLNGFTSEDTSYSYAGFLPGKVVLRRVNNARVSGNFSLEWVRATATTSKNYNLFSAYQSNLDSFLNSNTYNKGADNLFDNVATNSNDIERLDWIFNSGYSTTQSARVGFAVFDKGSLATHDPFVIAAITSVDLSGNPLTYGNVLRVVPGDYGDPGPSITYRTVKGPYGSNLLSAGTATQSLGGVFISLDDLGVAAGTTIHGYSLFANDLPNSATPADLVDYTNPTFFPLNTIGAAGGLDLVAVTGLFISNTILPVGFTNFSAVENNNIVSLNWAVENESAVQRYEVERSENGINYFKVGEVLPAANSNSGRYSQPDNVASVTSNQLYYRIKQYANDGSYAYSNVIVVKRDKMALSIIIYPNPVRSNLNLKINSAINDNAIINVFNSAGLKVIHQQATLANGNNSFTVDGINKLPVGIYQLSITRMSSGNTVTKQFTKE